MRDWRKWVRAGILIVLLIGGVVAVVVWGPGLFGRNDASQSAPAAPAQVEVFPQEGYVNSTIVGANTLTCDEEVVASTTLILGGTVDDNTTLITTQRSPAGVTITFRGNNVALSGIVNGTVGFNVPDSARGTDKPSLFLATRNLGPIGKLVLCGGGM